MRRWRRSTAAAILAAVLLTLAPPVAAPVRAATRCPEFEDDGKPRIDLENLTEPVTFAARDVVEFPFYSPSAHLLTAAQPSPAELARAGNNPDVHNPKHNKALGADTEDLQRLRLAAYWNRHREGGGTKSWETYRAWYVEQHSNAYKGHAFRDLVAKTFVMSGSKGWVCEKVVKVPDPDTEDGEPEERDIDLAREQGRPIAIECKAVKRGVRQIPADQLAKDKKLIAADQALPAGQRPIRIQMLSEAPTKTVVERLSAAGIRIVVLPAKGKPVTAAGDPVPTGPAGAGTELFTTGGQQPATGGVVDEAATAPSTAAEAEEMARTAAQLAAEGPADPDDLPGDTGGIDFSSLELRYIADPADGEAGLKYSFSAKPASDGQLSWGGLAAAQQASDAFFVWLALRPEHFWVNLNPNEPDRIIEERLGGTDAGRVLLEADLQMKKTVAKLIHPDSPGGQRFWDSLRDTDDEQTCLSFRQWIVPGTATVHEQDGGLYIVDAPLIVKSETEYFDSGNAAAGAAAGCKPGDEATERHNAEVFRTRILTKVQEAVNTAPEYAELRRVYLSRVAAEWYRQRSTHHNTAFADVVNSGDVSRWPSRTGWQPREVFDRYVKSYTDGEFDVTRETARGNVIETRTYVYGGVDFSASPRSELGEAAFTGRWGGLPSTVAQSLTGAVEDDGRIWLGGASADRPAVPFKVTSLLTWAAGAVMALLVAALFVRSLVRQRRRHRQWQAARR